MARKRRKRKAKRKVKRKVSPMKISPKKMKEFSKMEMMYHHRHSHKTCKIAFGIILLALVGLMYLNMITIEYILILFALFVLVKAFLGHNCC